jgi:hypothetical protein
VRRLAAALMGAGESQKIRREGGATNDRAATIGAASPSTCAGRSMLRPYENGRRKVTALRRADKRVKRAGETPFDFAQDKPALRKSGPRHASEEGGRKCF